MPLKLTSKLKEPKDPKTPRTSSRLASYKLKKKIGSATHLTLSALLPIIVYVLIAVLKLPIVALALVLASKWQTFVVKPRFLWTNIKLNAVDLIFKLSIMSLLTLLTYKISLTSGSIKLSLHLFQIALTAAYFVWNSFIKKLSSESGMLLQALITQFLSLSAIFWLMGFSTINLQPILTLPLSFIASYACAQHALYAYEESSIKQLAAFWAIFITYLTFIFGFWAHHITLLSGAVYIPLPAILSVPFGLLASRLHLLIEDSQTEGVKKSDLLKKQASLTNYTAAAIAMSFLIAIFILIR
jgi:hypothetical protein